MKKISENIKKLFKNDFFIDTIVSLITLIVTIISAVLFIQMFTVHALFSILFGILASMIIIQMFTGWKAYLRDQEIQKIVHKMELLELPKKTFIKRGDRESFDALVKKANQFDVLGLTCIGLLAENAKFLIQKKHEGCKIRLVFTNPFNNEIAKCVCDRIPELPSQEIFIKHLETSLDYLMPLSNNNHNGGYLKLFLLDSFPSLSMVIIDGDTDDALMSIELYLFSCSVKRRPSMIISKSEDKEVFEQFKEEFETIINKSKELDNKYYKKKF